MGRFDTLCANDGFQGMTTINSNRVSALLGTILFLGPAVHAEEQCPVEIKLLLSPGVTRTAIASLGFEHEAAGRVYFFDTDALDLSMQGAIVRVRQGGDNDLTVKVRLPNGNRRADSSPLHKRFPCEIDRTQMGESTSFAVKRKYKAAVVPDLGADIRGLLSVAQRDLLHEAGITVDWSKVRRIADIDSTKWEATARSPSGQIALELWEWPAGKVLELSAKVEYDAAASKYAELERLASVKNLSLSASQDTKTSMVLKTAAAHPSPPR